MKQWDAVVVGAGPNGLAAAIELAQNGYKVCLLEGASTIGGGVRSAELIFPGCLHDICSAIHPLAVASPFFRSLPLEDYGLQWVDPPLCLAHPFDDGTAASLEKSVAATAARLGPDGDPYRRLVEPFVRGWESLGPEILGPPRAPRSPLLLLRFGLRAILPAWTLMRRFQGREARALIAGLAAHSFLPLTRMPSAAFALTLGILAHVAGWPFPRGGAQKLADTLAAIFQANPGCRIVTSRPVRSLSDLPPARAYLLDVTPRQLADIAGDALPPLYRRRLGKYRYGPAAFKVDWVLSSPIPWTAPECRQAGTLHLGGSAEEIAEAEARIWQGKPHPRPFVLVAQHTNFDPSRAEPGRHVAWAYCHVPPGDDSNMTEAIEQQVERFAPGFRDLILGRHTLSPADLEKYNPNYVGGDINGGVQDLGQLFTRPVARLVPYSTPRPDLFLCSSSTPPGGGVHGMCGYHAAQAAIRRILSRHSG